MKTRVDYNFLKNCLNKDISFAAYSLPGESNFNVIAQKGNAKEVNDLSEIDKGFIIHPFDQNQCPILVVKDEFFLKEGDDIDTIGTDYKSAPALTNLPTAGRSAPAQPKNNNYTEVSKKEYLQSFDVFKQALDENEFQKLVLSRIKKVMPERAFNIIDLFEKLNKNYLHSFNHISYSPQSGIWLGASPEILLEITNDTAKTVALAGTQKKSDNYNWESKEIEEQKFVVDYIEEILKKQVSSISIKNETVEAGNVAHLKTNFSFPAKEVKNIPELIEELHPTPAVCGIPKKEALNFITKNESHQRAYYTGFVGPYNLKEETHLFVNLRCLHFDGEKLNLFVGGGLTKDSVAEKEWQETELKAQTLENLI